MQDAGGSGPAPLRVLITSNTLGYGGAEVQRVQLANALARRGHHVTLVLLQDGGPLLEMVASAVTIERTTWRRPRPRPSGAAVVITGTTRTEVAFGALWRTTRPRRRWLVAAHTAPEPERPTYDRDVAWLIRRSDGVIALTAGHWAQLTRFQPLHRSDPFLVPNGVDPPINGPPPRQALDGDVVRLAFLGRLVEDKGLQVVIAALTGLADRAWTLSVHGDGPFRGELERRTPPAIRHRVNFCGWTPEPRAALAASDLLLLPSRREAFPMVLLEAMSSGVPVMAAATGAVPEMLADGAGILVAGQDEDLWHEALRQVLDDPDLLSGLAARAWSRAGEYSVSRMLDGYDAALARVTAR